VRSEPYVGVPVTSGKPADEGKLATSLLKPKPVSRYRTAGYTDNTRTHTLSLSLNLILKFNLLKCIEKHGLTLYPGSHFLEDLAQNLLPQMPDKVRPNTIVGGA